jgi:hypothetical protein
MKFFLYLVIIMQTAAAVFGADRQPADYITPAASAAITPANEPEEIPFGALAASARTTSAKTKITDWRLLSPTSPDTRWYFRLIYKNQPGEIKKVTGYVNPEIIDCKPYYYYSVPEENKKNLVRFTDKGAYIRSLTFPLFGFIFLDITLDPEIQYMRFPLVVGDSWSSTSTGTAKLFGFINISRSTTAKFSVLGEADVMFQGKKVRIFKIKDMIDKGNGEYANEEVWYGVGVGLIYQDTEAYTLELYKFEPGSVNTRANTKGGGLQK